MQNKWQRITYMPATPLYGDGHPVTAGPEHIALSLKAARDGMVLLKNDGALLPLQGGIRLALFNYTYGLNGFSVPGSQYYMVNLLSQRDKFLNDVRTAEGQADMTVCFLHIGEEYQYQPTAFQQGWVHSLIDAGADLVICAHPHVVEPAGYVTTAAGNSGLVFWSCGNFVSAQTKIPRILGGLADVTIEKNESGTRVTDWSFLPTVSHFCGPDVRVFLLKDYPEELAAVHHVNGSDAPLTTGKLWELWKSITGFDRMAE